MYFSLLLNLSNASKQTLKASEIVTSILPLPRLLQFPWYVKSLIIEEVLICDPTAMVGMNSQQSISATDRTLYSAAATRCKFNGTLATGPSSAITGLDVVTCSRHGSLAVVYRIDGRARLTKQGSSNHRLITWFLWVYRWKVVGVTIVTALQSVVHWCDKLHLICKV